MEQKNKIGPFASKRFIAFLIAVILFVLMIFLTAYPPLECAGAITMICGSYIGAQSLRSSNIEK